MPTQADIALTTFDAEIDERYQAILTAAKALDLSRLQELIQAFLTLDIRGKAGLTPAAELAKQGDYAAVRLLMSKFNVAIHPIAYGFTLSGNIEQAEFLRHHYGANPSYIAIAAAAVGNISYAEYLRTKHRAEPDAICYGIGLAGNRAELKAYLHTLIHEHQAKPLYYARGCAYIGNEAEAEKYRQLYHLDRKLLAYEASMGGQISYAERLRQMANANNILLESNTYYNVKGAARGGYLNYIESLPHVSSCYTIFSGCISGYFHLRPEKNSYEEMNMRVAAAIAGSHFTYAATIKRSVETSTRGFNYSAKYRKLDFSLIAQYLSYNFFKEDIFFNPLLSNEAVIYALSRADEELSAKVLAHFSREYLLSRDNQAVLEKRNRVAKIIHRYQLPFNLAKAWSIYEVRMLCILLPQIKKATGLPNEIIYKILQTFIPITTTEIDKLLLQSQKLFIRQMIKADYMSKLLCCLQPSYERAVSFRQALETTQTSEEINTLVHQQINTVFYFKPAQDPVGCKPHESPPSLKEKVFLTGVCFANSLFKTHQSTQRRYLKHEEMNSANLDSQSAGQSLM